MKKKLSTTKALTGVFTLLAAALVLMHANGVIFTGSVHAESQETQDKVRPVPAARAVPYQPDQSFRFPGKVKATNKAQLSFQVAGRIEQFNILEGQQVKKGEVLAGLDQKSLAYAVKAARARFVATKQDFYRASQLYSEKVISRAQLDRASSAHEIARAELDIKRKTLADSKLIAPFSGLVAKRYVEKKEHVSKGQPVLLLQNIEGVDVEVQLPEQLVAKGGTEIIDQLKVRFDACPDQKFDAKAMELSMESSKDTRTYALVIKLASPPRMNILPGMTATVTGFIRENGKSTAAKGTVLVPVEAVAFAPDSQPFVWVIDADTLHAKKRIVSVGAMHGDSIEITKGVAVTELVAVAALNSLDETQRVRPMKKGKQGLEG